MLWVVGYKNTSMMAFEDFKSLYKSLKVVFFGKAVQWWPLILTPIKRVGLKPNIAYLVQNYVIEMHMCHVFFG